ncbi:hypothetical protein [Streptomyces sp. NPDC008125]|uniref:hypothetical protein n=1 Tax=Streptomyces sp. NPDC008125 TaxID=3364811 RepID=UPI0036EDCFFE
MPLRLVVGAQYGDAALSVYIKIAVLALRPELCRAKVSVIAEYLGLSKSAVERALTQLTTAGTDGVAEVLTRRITSRDGDGESAQRWVRPMDDDELFVWLPARAATSMAPRQLRLYAGISYAQARRIPLALSDLQDLVRHQYGDSAGEPLGARQVMRLLDDLETAGWITVHRRQGPRGRHAYEAHLRPLRPVLDDAADADEVVVEPAATTTAPTATSDIHDGSAPRTADGSPSVDDTTTDRPLKSAGGSGIRRRRVTGSYRAAPVENRPAGPTYHGAGHDEKRSNTSGGTYRGPELQLSPRVWRVLEPVRHHLPEISAYVLRRIGQEIGRQLCAGTGEERLTDRLRLRYATTTAPRDVGRWILGAALVRHGCSNLPSCESGFTWTTGAPCPGCYDPGHDDGPAIEEEPPPARAQQPEPRPPAREPRAWVPWPPPPVPDPEPLPADPDASSDAVRQALAEHGVPAAIQLYGRARVWPLLTTDPEGTPA